MNKKLKIKFIFYIMLAVLIVFLAILLAVGVFTYTNVSKNADDLLEYIAFHYDELNDLVPDKPQFTQETPYETRYFSILIDRNSSIIEINMKRIKSVTESEAIQCVKRLYSKNENKGYWKTFKYITIEEERGTKYLFVDISKQINLAEAFFFTALKVEIVAFIAIFVLVCLFSNRILSPIINSYEKQKKFITDAGHELKTPLTVINANAELMEIENGENEYTRTIKKQVQRLSIMTKNLIMLSKIDENSIKEEKKEFDISESILDVCETFKNVGAKNSIDIINEVEEKIIFKGDEKLIRELFFILTDNAIKYGKNYLKIKMIKVKNKLQVEFANDTDGINEENLNRLFDRFYRTPEARGSDIEGSGIGLSIAKEIVSLHKGEITINNNDGNELCVIIILPFLS